MTPTEARLTKLARMIDEAQRRGDEATVALLKLERGDLRLMQNVERVAALLRVAS